MKKLQIKTDAKDNGYALKDDCLKLAKSIRKQADMVNMLIKTFEKKATFRDDRIKATLMNNSERDGQQMFTDLAQIDSNLGDIITDLRNTCRIFEKQFK